MSLKSTSLIFLPTATHDQVICGWDERVTVSSFCMGYLHGVTSILQYPLRKRHLAPYLPTTWRMMGSLWDRDRMFGGPTKQGWRTDYSKETRRYYCGSLVFVHVCVCTCVCMWECECVCVCVYVSVCLSALSPFPKGEGWFGEDGLLVCQPSPLRVVPVRPAILAHNEEGRTQFSHVSSSGVKRGAAMNSITTCTITGKTGNIGK